MFRVILVVDWRSNSKKSQDERAPMSDMMNPTMFMNPFMMNPSMMNMTQNQTQTQNDQQIPNTNQNMFWNPQMLQQMQQQMMNPAMFMNPYMMNLAMMNQQMSTNNVKIPVPEWNLELSFEAWKRSTLVWATESKMSMGQKVTLVTENLKKNKERPNLKLWIIQNIDEDPTFDKTSSEALNKLLEKMEDKFQVSNWKKS